MKNDFVKNDILGVDVTNASKEEILDYVFQKAMEKGEKFYVVTPNPEIITFATRHKSFQEILNKAEISLCDGVGLIWAGKILGRPFKTRFTGVDFIEEVCKRSVRKPVSIGFLGGKDRVAERAAECLLKKHPELNIVFVSEEWREKGFDWKPGTKKDGEIDILFVAFGFPKQEEWLAGHTGKLPYRIGVGVGGALDYLSGEVSRAPKAVRAIGMEWLYRLIRQPWRWRRQLALIEFIRLVLKERA